MKQKYNDDAIVKGEVSYVNLEEPSLPANAEYTRTWRAFLYWPIKWLLFLLFRPLVWGRENLPSEGNYIVVANHKSIFDPIMIMAFVNIWPDWVAKESLFQKRWIARFLMSLGIIPVERKINDVVAMRRILTRLMEGRIIGIFPEGTRVKSEADKLINRPKSVFVDLAKKRKLRILPISIEGEYKIFRQMKIHIAEPVDLLNCKGQSSEDLAMKIMADIYKVCGESYPSAYGEEK